MLEIRDFVLYSQPVGIIHRLRWFFKTRSAGIYEGRRRSDEGMLVRRVYITHGHTMCARHAHARNTLEERWERWACVRSTLGECSWCARSAIDLSRRTHNAFPACAPECVSRWSSALCASLVSFWCVHSFVELRAHFCVCTKISTHATNDDECISLFQRARRKCSAW